MSRVLLILFLATGGLLLMLSATAARSGGDPATPPNEAPLLAQEHEQPTSTPLPACTFDDLPAAMSAYDQWDQTVLDTVYALPESYAPPDLVAAAGAFPAGQAGAGEFQVRAIVIDDLRALLAAAAEAGVELAIQSAYRSYGYQQSTFDYWVDLNGRESALATSARPGHSEHQLGTAIDFRSLHGPAAWDLPDWAQTPEGGWLAANARHYGFAMSYPAGSKDITCYSYEPWHYRYLGRQLTTEIYDLGVTPRELLWARATGARLGSLRYAPGAQQGDAAQEGE